MTIDAYFVVPRSGVTADFSSSLAANLANVVRCLVAGGRTMTAHAHRRVPAHTFDHVRGHVTVCVGGGSA